MLATVDALFPLSLLEAVRNVDTPIDQLDTEYVDELRNKRFGLSDTVYTQIKRHSEAVRKGQRTGQDEVIGLARLIGRRADAEAIFRAAGRYTARQSYQTISAPNRQLMRLLPAAVARPLAFRYARKIVARYLGGNVRRVGSFLMVDVPRSITLGTAPGSVGCTFYEASVRELLQRLIGSIGTVEHVRCAARGEGACEWRADWRAIDRTAGLEQIRDAHS